MEEKTKSTNLGFLGILFFIFLILKLTNHINWSWWWVTSPLWGPFVIFIIVFVGMFLVLFFKKKYGNNK
jgi:uncharacterized membrane protein